MSHRNELATINQQSTVSVIPSSDEWSTIHQMAQALLPTGFLPNTIKTPEQATAIILKGRELQIPPMHALSSIVVVQGKPTANAELMLALVQRDHGLDAMWVEESTNEYCTVGYRGGRKERSYTFSIKDAEQAGLFKNQVWKQYPAAMLRARCISAVARMAFPGSIAGMYSPGELGEPVEVNAEGDVTSSITATISKSPQANTSSNERREATMRRLHAVGREHDFGHEDLRMIAASMARKQGITLESLKDAPGALLARVADALEQDPETARAWLATQKRDTGGDAPDEVDPDTGEIVQLPAQSELDPELNPSDEELGIVPAGGADKYTRI